MLEDPGLDTATLAMALQEAWTVDASAFAFVPGYDMHAASFEVATAGIPVFLKVRFGLAPTSARSAGASFSTTRRRSRREPRR